MADETAAKEAVQVAYTEAQRDMKGLQEAAVVTCQALDGDEGVSGSSLRDA